MADQRTKLITRLQHMLPQWRQFAEVDEQPAADMAVNPAEPMAFELEVDDDLVTLVIRYDSGGGLETSHVIEDRVKVSFHDGKISEFDPDNLPGPPWDPDAEDPVAALADVIEGVVERHLGLYNATNAPDVIFHCPYCDAVAEESAPRHTLSAARACACGAIGLANPAVDQDEIIDDAIELLEVRIPDAARGDDAALIEAIRAAGYEVREGWSGGQDLHPWGPQVVMWFRRS